MSYKEVGERVLEVSLIAVGTGAVDLAGGKSKLPEVFV